jgi:hypothetical protein
MTSRTALRRLSGFLFAATVVACSDLLDPNGAPGRTDPTVLNDTSGGGDTTSPPDTSTPPDTTTPPDTAPPDTTPPDTTPTDTTPDAAIDGVMIGIDSTVTPFAELGPIKDVSITLYRVRYAVDSSSTDSLTARYDSVDHARSNSSGKFAFHKLVPAVYLMRARPPANSGYRDGEIGVRAYSKRSLALPVTIKFYLHKNAED